MALRFTGPRSSPPPALLLVCCASLASCASVRPGRDVDKDRNLEAVSSTEPTFESLPRPAPATRNATPVASRGECAPRYANGLHGSCINHQPCRGFGIVDESGQPVCACYAIVGGCHAGERCDTIRKACIPDSQPGWGRAPDD